MAGTETSTRIRSDFPMTTDASERPLLRTADPGDNGISDTKRARAYAMCAMHIAGIALLAFALLLSLAAVVIQAASAEYRAELSTVARYRPLRFPAIGVCASDAGRPRNASEWDVRIEGCSLTLGQRCPIETIDTTDYWSDGDVGSLDIRCWRTNADGALVSAIPGASFVVLALSQPARSTTPPPAGPGPRLFAFVHDPASDPFRRGAFDTRHATVALLQPGHENALRLSRTTVERSPAGIDGYVFYDLAASASPAVDRGSLPADRDPLRMVVMYASDPERVQRWVYPEFPWALGIAGPMLALAVYPIGLIAVRALFFLRTRGNRDRDAPVLVCCDGNRCSGSYTHVRAL